MADQSRPVELGAKSDWIAQAREDYHIFRTTIALLDATEARLAWAESTLEPSSLAGVLAQIDAARQRYRDYLATLDRGSAKLADFLSGASSRSAEVDLPPPHS